MGRALFISDPVWMLKGTLLKALSSPGEEQKRWGHQQQDGAVLWKYQHSCRGGCKGRGSVPVAKAGSVSAVCR